MECRNEALKIFQQHGMMNTYILLPLLLCRLWCADGSFEKKMKTLFAHVKSLDTKRRRTLNFQTKIPEAL